MYQTVNRIEEENHTERIRLNFRYRSKAQQQWMNAVGEINQQRLYIHKNKIAILRPITGRSY